MTDLRARLTSALSAPVDVAWLAALRIALGGVLCVSMLRFIGYGWVDDFFVAPRFHFKYWGFHWVQPLPGPLLHALFWALAACAAAMALGLFFRAAALLFLIGFAYLQLVDVTTYLNHYYLAALLVGLLLVAPANRAWSLDALLRPSIRVAQIPSFWLWLFRAQVGIVYTFAGLAKLHGDWLIHAQPLRTWLAGKTDLPLLGPLFAQPFAAPLFSWCGFLFDTFVIWLLLFRRTRLLAFAAVLAFHAMTRALFPIGMFPFIMVSAALVFFDPGWPRKLLRLGRPASQAVAPWRFRRAAIGLAGAFLVIQIALPLRFLLYGGNVRWHEQGMRFSWRVMVREKNGSVTFEVRDPATGRTRHVSPRQYLSRLQEREMAAQPDLILQLAHRIRDDEQARTGRPVEVRADAWASLNGRRMERLIDPRADLARVQDGLLPAAWILPAPAGPPPLLRAVPARLASRP